MPNARDLNYVLGALGGELELLSRRWNQGTIPPLQCLGINRQDGTPGNVIGWFVCDKGEFKKLSSPEKRRVVEAMLTGVFSYSNWNAVLLQYGLSATETASPQLLDKKARMSVSRFGGGGEGESHQVMKAFMASHPELYRLPTNLRGEIEHPFASADCLDVLFRNGDEWIGVEGRDQCQMISTSIEGSSNA